MPDYTMTLDKSEKIMSIRATREVTGFGLKESKEAVEAAIAQNAQNPVLHFTSTRSIEGLNDGLSNMSERSCSLNVFRIRANIVGGDIKLSAVIENGACNLKIRSITGSNISITTNSSNIQEIIDKFIEWAK